MIRNRRMSRTLLAFLVLTATLILLTSCNGGQRPSLVEPPTPTPEPRLELELPPAPAGTPVLEPADASLPAESSADDALDAWARSRGVAYLDACTRVTTGPGELCDIPTERDTVRLLGPSADEIWYVVTIEADTTFGAGTSYRVIEVALPEQY